MALCPSPQIIFIYSGSDDTRGWQWPEGWCYPCVCASERVGLSGVYLQFPEETLMLFLNEHFMFHQTLEAQTQNPTLKQVPYFWHVVFANICCFNHKWQPNSNLGCIRIAAYSAPSEATQIFRISTPTKVFQEAVASGNLKDRMEIADRNKEL